MIRKLRGHYMPPPGSPRPDDQTYNAVVSSLVKELDSAAAAQPNPGRTGSVRRLTRTEYQNAIRDLLGVEVDVTPLLPADESSHGFDNVTVGNLSPTLLERYLSAGEKISRLAVGGTIPSPGGDTIMLPADLTQEQRFANLPTGLRGGTSVNYNFPVDAEYEIQLRLVRDSRERVAGLNEPHELQLLLDKEQVKSFTVTPPTGEDEHAVDLDLNVRIPVKAGPHEVSVAFLKKPWILLPTERQPYQAHFNMERHPRIQPALYTVTINGPYGAQSPGDTPSRRRIFVCKPAKPAEEEACAKQILTTLTRRAYRRPVTDADLETPLKFYRRTQPEGGFEAGIQTALYSVLVNPEFIFRVESDPAERSAQHRLSH